MKSRRFILGSVLGLSLASGLARAQSVPPGNTGVIGSLPDQVDLVIGARSLKDLRNAPQGRALERFLSETTDWARTAGAWQDLSGRLDMTVDDAVDTLLGSGAVLAVDGASEQAGPLRFAVVSAIKTQVRRDLAARLGAVPRSVAGDVPVLAVESGAFHLAMPAAPGDQGTSRLVLSSDKRLFDGTVSALTQQGTQSTLAATPQWARIRPLTDADLFLLVRGRDAGGSRPDEFIAFAGTATPSGWTARFTASDAVIDGGIARVAAAVHHWPSEAVDHLEQDATLLVAGAPPSGNAQSSTLLGGLLSMMSVPNDLRARLEGTAIVALHSPESGGAGGSLVVALPLRSISGSVDIADAWAASISGRSPDDTGITVTDGVRLCTLGAKPGVMGGLVSGDGQMAWCYAAAGGVLKESETPGWLVLAVRFGPGEEPQGIVRRTASQLAHDAGKDRATLFRLVVEPRKLMTVLGADPGKSARTLPVERGALRWLDRVDSRIERQSTGYVEGSINVDFDLKLLQSPAPPAAAQGQPAQPQGE